MLISDSYSDKTSSTLPILISFSSHLKTKKIKKIRDFLRHHPNCQKYMKKGPNFVADGKNEFRLYYVDSSLYTDEVTLKRLNVEKEEIILGSTSEDSLERPLVPLEEPGKALCDVENAVSILKSSRSIEKVDKGTFCSQDSYVDLRCYTSVSETPRVMTKVSKSFQIGPDLRFNVVYVNTDIQFNSLTYNTADKCIQTEGINFGCIFSQSSEASPDYSVDSSAKYRIRCSPSFLLGNQSRSERPEKRKLSTFKDFYSKMEEKKAVRKFTDDSEFNIESRQTSVKFSIKKSPSFVANYILEILNTRGSNGDILTSEIYEQSIVNIIKYDDLRKRISMKRVYGVETKNEIANRDIVKYDYNVSKYDQKTPQKEEAKKIKHEHHAHRRKGDRNKTTNKNMKNCNKVDKHRRYQNTGGRPNSYKVECLFKCTNMDFFLKKSHYAILKKYHRKIKERKQRRDNHRNHHGNKHGKGEKKHAEKMNKNPDHNKHKNEQNKTFVENKAHEKISHFKMNPTGDSRTRTTISGFLQTYKPWHWQDNSKLSVCIDEECFTEDYLEEENNYDKTTPYQWKISKIRKFFDL